MSVPPSAKPPVPPWGWACLGGIIAVFGLMVYLEREPDQYLTAALVVVAAFILGVSIPPPWGGGGQGVGGA